MKKWDSNEKLEWGVAKVEFFIKDKDTLFGNLKVPPKSSTPLDEGHIKGEFLAAISGEATVKLFKDNNEINKMVIKKGEAVFIPEKIDHQTINSGDEEVSLIFFLNL